MCNSSKYITAGISCEIANNIQVLLWAMIEMIPVQERDYLQVFKIEKALADFFVCHSQEIPEYNVKYYFDNQNLRVKRSCKVFVINDGINSTMMLAEEY